MVAPILQSSKKCLKFRFNVVKPVVLIAGAITLVVPGFILSQLQTSSYAEPPALALPEIFHRSEILRPIFCVSQPEGRFELSNVSAKSVTCAFTEKVRMLKIKRMLRCKFFFIF